jgi:hypothetical protein
MCRLYVRVSPLRAAEKLDSDLGSPRRKYAGKAQIGDPEAG